MSNTLSKYLPTYEGVFFNRANSPSAASIPDFKTMKKAAAKKFGLKYNKLLVNQKFRIKALREWV